MKIIEKKVLADAGQARIIKFVVSSPLIARKAGPGQFVALMVSEKGERIPLTVVDKDIEKGTITLIVQEAGLTTKLLVKLNPGDSLYALAGPLGRSTEVRNYGKAILVGGGVGIAEIYPVAKALEAAGNHITAILGVKSKDVLILEKELKSICDEVFVTTDDGSYARKGFVTDVLKELLAKEKYDLVYSVGPIPMMEKTALTAKSSGAKVLVSLNSLMVDATGMCGCCRVTVGGEVKFACVDGPEFDAGLVDWQELQKRSTIYEDKEKHICRLNKL